MKRDHVIHYAKYNEAVWIGLQNPRAGPATPSLFLPEPRLDWYRTGRCACPRTFDPLRMLRPSKQGGGT